MVSKWARSESGIAYTSAGVLGLSVEQSIHGEKTNTADQHPDIVRTLTDRALAWRRSVPQLALMMSRTVAPKSIWGPHASRTPFGSRREVAEDSV